MPNALEKLILKDGAVVILAILLVFTPFMNYL